MQSPLEILAFMVLFVLQIQCCIASNCFLNSEMYECTLGTLTPYRLVANYDDRPTNYPGCTETKMWLVFRHGTRYPAPKNIARMIEALPTLKSIILNNFAEGRTNLTAEDAESLSGWKLSFTEEDGMKLAEEGENEMIDLAERYQSRFPTLMPHIYDNETYKFKFTDSQRTRESARHFAAGLFGWHNSQNIFYPEAEDKDPILRFYKRCDRWMTDVKHNPSAQKEKEKFIESDAVKEAVRQISKHIGHELNYTSANLIRMMCAYETAWHRNFDSPWCSFLSPEHHKVFEFLGDLEYYWRDGYGHKLTYEQACPALRDMFTFVSSEEGPRVSAYFTHSGTLLKILALLGVAKDDDILTHDSFAQLVDNREWRTSIIDTFSTNIAFVLYNCTTGGPSLLFMHQERAVTLPGCPLNKPCPVSIMRALYPDQEEECQFESMCRLS